jgi:hypothetical protein
MHAKHATKWLDPAHTELNPKWTPDIRKRVRAPRPEHDNRKRAYRRRAKLIIDLPFLCIDGEAIGNTYVLLTASNGETLYNADGLRTKEILEWLFRQGVQHYWLFAGTYDLNNFLHGLSRKHIERLNDKCRVRWGEYTICHYYGKHMSISTGEGKDRRTIHLWDFYSFVQLSFVEWLKKWQMCDAETLSFIKTKKDERGSFTEETMAETRKYNLLEVKLLHAGIDKFYNLVRDSGYIPDVFYSPGSLAVKAFDQHKVYPHLAREETPEEVQAVLSEAYYGGRFEVSHVGRVEGPLHHYDIKSAYPAQMVQLPSMAGGQWEHTGKIIDIDENALRLVQVSWKRKKRTLFGPLPVRLDVGSIRYPLQQDAPRWYHNSEVREANQLSSVVVHDSWTFTPASEERPFAYLSELYALKSMQANKMNGTDKIYKLIINSSYGKLAQQAYGDKPPKYNQPFYAGFITAGTRAMLLQAVNQHPNDILFLATDGFVSKREHELAVADSMGAWEYEPLPWVFIVQSGIYFWEDESGIQQHSRGFGKGKLAYAEVEQAFLKNEDVAASNSQFIGYKTALKGERWEEWCTWNNKSKVMKWTTFPRRRDGPRKDGYMLTYPPLKAQTLAMDLLERDLYGSFDNGSIEVIEQPDMPEGATL